jgi:hypothetical protein
MKLTRIVVLLLAVLVGASAGYAKKKYKFDLNHDYMVVQTASAANGKLVKAWAYGKNTDSAMDQARMDAVAAAMFTGIQPSAESQGMGIGQLPPLVDQSKYNEYQSFFTQFFTEGEFLNYVRDVNSAYPTGENNIKTPQGQRVGINLVVYYDELRKMLETNGIRRALGDQFHY